MTTNKIEYVIILLPEITKGMKSIGSKSLLDINKDYSILECQIRFFKKYYGSNIKIILCTGFEHDKVQKKIQKYKHIEYSYNSNYETDNQCGSLSKCLLHYRPKNTIIVNSGVIFFDKIKIQIDRSATFFIKSSLDKRNTFDIGCNHINRDSYLFYGLDYRWIEFLYIDEVLMNKILEDMNNNNISNLFLFEYINHIQSLYNSLSFELLDKNIYPLKINTIKDVPYAKKQYKKHTSVYN
jgi:hypothetical protein